MKSLGELFVESQGEAILYDGKRVVQTVEIPISHPCLFTARVIKCDQQIRQGITLRVEPGKIEFQGAKHKSVICWYDHEPWTMAADLLPARETSKLFVWNSWSAFAVTEAWTGNAGMVVEEPDADSDLWIARCSAGVGPVNFDDFVFTFAIKPILVCLQN
jgi:hypothetical protein